MRIVAISDTHGKWKNLKIPKCDLLLSTGDYSFRGEKHMLREFHSWLDEQDADHIISVQGNHETWVEANFEEAKTLALKECPRAIFIDEGLLEIEDTKIWCSAITPWFHNWAWNRHRGLDIKAHWDKIPEKVDVLATHGPALAYGDLLGPNGSAPGKHVGCEDLLNTILRIQPKFHVFGHIHEGYGIYSNGITTFINSSICNEYYKPVNSPIAFEVYKTT